MIGYRRMTGKDIPAALSLWRSMEGIYLHPDGEDSEAGIGVYLRRNRGFSFVALDEQGNIVGTILSGHDGRRGLVHHLAVRPEHRGNGIAAKLLELSKARLKRAGIRKILLFVLNENVSARSFYEHIGWDEEEDVRVFSKRLRAGNSVPKEG